MNNIIIVTGAKGRMGQTIIRLAQADPDVALAAVVERPGHEGGLESLGCEVSTDIASLLPKHPGAVVIDFTAPAVSVANAQACAANGNPIVIGTTGLDEGQLAALAEVAGRIPLFHAPNMSVGINVLLKILPDLVKKLGESYDVEMFEIHHNKKADSPSGTAVRLADCLAEARGWTMKEVGNYGRHGIIGPRPHKEIGVQTLRGGDVVGIHTMYFLGTGERIEVTHQAHSRDTFASGALRAAKWITTQQPGKVYSMQDVF
ncbi:MAG: 4-hydroxy-tetrahydrodipicolinate reductase [Desulfovibrionaceae bacterium]|jgi:4-hydroxy-tetrahydrodipicolinate reductase|nr:4-hydroxy-tetrahydrodipicolinate reductase [Desulfovibrionaceae bacterium]